MAERERWVQTPRGYLRVPPEHCPACGWGWPTLGSDRPREGSMTCGCGAGRQHSLWTCSCGALVTEGCLDVALWSPVTTPAGLADDQRWAC